jgi:hypothetical protein
MAEMINFFLKYTVLNLIVFNGYLNLRCYCGELEEEW